MLITFINIWFICSAIVGSAIYWTFYSQFDCWSFNKWANVGKEFTEQEYDMMKKVAIIISLTPLSPFILIYFIYKYLETKFPK